MFEPQRTTEVLFAVPTDASHADKLNVHKEFLPQSNEVDEQSLLALWEKGRSAWKNVSSASAWVEALRGNI